MSKSILGEVYTDGAVAALERLQKGPISALGMDPRTPRALEARGLCRKQGDTLTLTEKGAQVVQALSGKPPRPAALAADPPQKAVTATEVAGGGDVEEKQEVRGGGRRGSHGAAAAQRGRPAAPANEGVAWVTDEEYAQLVAEVKRRYEADLAAIERTRQIAAALCR